MVEVGGSEMRVGDKVKTVDTIYKFEGVITKIKDNGFITFESADGKTHYFWAEDLKVIEEVEDG